jgi:adenine deaminase
VPPDLGVANAGVVDMVAVVVITDVLGGVVVDWAADVVVVSDLPQPEISTVMVNKAIKRMNTLFIFPLLIFIFSANWISYQFQEAT